MTQGPKVLRQVLDQMTELSAAGKPILAVFDLDSTLFDVSPRLQRIIHDFAFDPKNEALFPKSVEELKKVEMQRTDWGIRTALMRFGLHTHPAEFHEALRDFWIENFFSTHYLQYDLPYPGAVKFVQKVHELGIEIVYLTGRDKAGMETGTREVLGNWKFPVDPKNTELVLKPIKGSDDALFKKEWFLKIPPQKYEKIWFFENEPVNVNAIVGHLPCMDIVFFDSTHSGKAHPPPELPRILDFILDAGEGE